MILTVEALTASVTLSDPNPVDGGWSTSVELGTSKSKAISQSQLEHIAPALKTLETAGKIAWSVAQDPALDMRAEEGTTQPLYVAGLDAATTAAAGGATLKIFGAGLLTNFTPATRVTGVTHFITYASKAGAPGNKITVAQVLGTGAIGVAVVGNAITVTLAVGGSTLTEVAAAVNAYPAAAALVIATVTGTGSTAAAALAVGYLIGGTGSTVGVKVGGKVCNITKLSDVEINVLVPALSPLVATNEAVVLVTVGPHTFFAGVLTLS